MTKQQFRDLLEEISDVQIERITKPELGKLGLPVLAEAVSQVRREMRIISTVLDDASEKQLQDATDAYSQYLNLLGNVARVSGTEFVNKRDQLGQELGHQWDILRGVWPYFAALALSRSGIIDDPDRAYNRIIEAGKKGEDALSALAENVIKLAQAEADKITENARKTARSFSIQAAQLEFDAASKNLNSKARIWGTGAILLATGFLAPVRDFVPC